MRTQEEYLEIVEKAVASINWTREPQGLYDPIAYTLSLGGKRIRPVLALMAYNMFSDNLNEIIEPAVGLEVFHNFTLLHDDIMDNADTRRGQATVHRRWNSNTAILSGDAMLIEAYRLIAKCPADKLKQVLDVFSKTAVEVCEGQQYDMDFETREDVTMADYIEMIRLKTAVLLGGSLKIGAIIGGASVSDSEYLYKFGINIGLAFQLRDDFLDTFGDRKVFGKNIGGDIMCGKKTCLLIYALNNATGEARYSLEKWLLTDGTGKAEEKIAAVTDVYRQVGADQFCQKQMEVYYDKALEALDKVKGNGASTDMLRDMAGRLMSRNR